MKLQKVAGSTSQILQIFIADSSSTTGAGLTGLAFNTASLTAYYHRKGDTTATAITLVTMTVGTFTSSGFAQIDATNMPGWYQLCPPDACFATGDCAIHLKGATNMAPLPIEIQVTAAGFNPDAAVTLANMTQISGDSTAADNLETAFDNTDGGIRQFGIVDQGTAQAVTGTTIRLRSGAAFADDELIGATVYIVSASTGAGQSRIITDYANTNDVATVDTWTTTPTGTIVYQVFASAPGSTSVPAPVNVVQVSGDATAADNAEAFFDGTGYAGTNNVIPTVTTATNVTTVNGLAANVITAAATASDFGTEVGTAVWATAARTLTANTNLNDLNAAGVRAAVGLASANLDTQLDALPTAAENATAVQNSAASSPLPANIKEINDAAITGDGTSGTEWGPA